MSASSQPLNKLQLELLQMFHYDVSDEQILEIKQLLAEYFAQKVTEDVDMLFEEKGWGKEKIEEWANEHMRTPYKTS